MARATTYRARRHRHRRLRFLTLPRRATFRLWTGAGCRVRVGMGGRALVGRGTGRRQTATGAGPTGASRYQPLVAASRSGRAASVRPSAGRDLPVAPSGAEDEGSRKVVPRAVRAHLDHVAGELT